jgi:hypothetical protein
MTLMPSQSISLIPVNIIVVAVGMEEPLFPGRARLCCPRPLARVRPLLALFCFSSFSIGLSYRANVWDVTVPWPHDQDLPVQNNFGRKQ